MSIFEVGSIALIGPFLSFIINDSNNTEIIQIYGQYLNVSNQNELILYMGLSIFILIFVSTIISIATTFFLAIFSAKTGAEISDSLFKFYCEKDINYHDAKNSSILTKNLSTESIRMTDLVINPFMQMNAKIVLSAFILIFIFFINPTVAIVGISIFFVVYTLIYTFVKKKLDKNGRDLTDVISKRFFVINECFGGIKETILLNKTDFYHANYTKLGKLYSRTRGVNHGISLAPRYLVEFISYGGVVLSILILVLFFPNNLEKFVGLIAVYAIASLKLLPALQQIYTSITQIKGNITSFSYLQDDLMSANHESKPLEKKEISSFKNIELENISFTYPSKDLLAIDNISIKISRGDNIAFVGSSGSGKSTLINLILGLIKPSSGKVFINGKINNFDLVKNRDSLIGYVPQDIYLLDKTILENIAFGIHKSDIDMVKLENAIKLARLEELIDSFEDGLNTMVGERGVQISGGQKQRIGIARALYNDPEILIFDEATSALDGASEKLILKSIDSLLNKKTIIMIAHRLNTVKGCHKIHILENGRIKESGSFEKLINESKDFIRMIEDS
tara:strand:- start:2718 stop:4412 length:1695 start_codon:yes stop_codon:yes gene_type:complete